MQQPPYYPRALWPSADADAVTYFYKVNEETYEMSDSVWPEDLQSLMINDRYRGWVIWKVTQKPYKINMDGEEV